MAHCFLLWLNNSISKNKRGNEVLNIKIMKHVCLSYSSENKDLIRVENSS